MSMIDGLFPTNVNTPTDMSSVSLEAVYTAVMVQRNMLLDGQVRDNLSQVDSNNKKMQDMQQYLAEARTAMIGSVDIVDEATWEVEGSTINLDNGYSINIEGDRQAWTITGPDGNETRIWGDPHVDENNDGSIDWDFKEDVSFVLGDGTTITVGTKDIGARNTVTDSLTITKGNQAIEVSGIANNSPSIGDVSLQGIELDAATNDGQIFYMGDNASEWNTASGQEITSNQAMSNNQTINEKDEDIPTMSNDMKQFLDDNGIAYPDRTNSSGAFSVEDWQSIITNMEGFNDSLSSVSQLEMVQLQSLMGKLEQGIEWQSNEISKFQGTTGTLTRNMA